MLIDRRNYAETKQNIIKQVKASSLIGFDIETHDADRHEGLNRAMRCDEDGRKAGNKKLLFDIRRTTVVGLSIYPDGAQGGYYFNLNHADVENRLTWGEVKEILDARNDNAYWVIHNAPFEIVMMKMSLGYDVTRYIDTLQLCVSAYGPDNYDIDKFYRASFSPLFPLMKEALKVFQGYKYGEEMNAEQAELFSKIVAKESDAAYSYNGLVKALNWGYGLKPAVKAWLDYDMKTFQDTLDDNVHMGQLTGVQVASYGADDAVWCVKLYHKVLAYMLATNPASVKAYFEQELPAVQVYADMWMGGWRINLEAVEKQRHEERKTLAATLRDLRWAIAGLLPFPDEPHEGLTKYDSWYQKSWAKKRKQIEDWVAMGNHADDYTEVTRVSGSMSEGWAGVKNKAGTINLGYWQTTRALMYDLIDTKCVTVKGKVQSNADARGKVVLRLQKAQQSFSAIKMDPEADNWDDYDADKSRLEAALSLIGYLSAIASIEQRSKLYIEPYLNLCDPETSCVYPVISSKLASRRMAMENPNGMQLAKRGESVFVRGFFLADNDEEVLVSEDWSSVELVAIGEQSGDPEFRKAFGQLPYEDLHTGAAADALSVIIPEMDEALLRRLNKLIKEEVQDINPRILMNRAGEVMEPAKAKSYWRTEVGKGSNFNYWYSGALSTVGERLGWTPDQMWEATEKYRQRFAVAEQWRVDTIDFVKRKGYVQLPDGHRRERFEATEMWVQAMRAKFANYLNHEGTNTMYGQVLKSIQRRAANQAVNTMIQGTCAAMMKRTMVRMHKEARSTGWFRLVAPIHDELVASVKKRHLEKYIERSKEIMCDHPDLFKTLPLHCTVSMGRTFQPFDAKKAPYGQIELDECPSVDWLPEEYWGKALPLNEIGRVLEYLG